ncbi:MAG: hypothetical protein AAFV29_13150 [Myxococcota bacterium]
MNTALCVPTGRLRYKDWRSKRDQLQRVGLVDRMLGTPPANWSAEVTRWQGVAATVEKIRQQLDQGQFSSAHVNADETLYLVFDFASDEERQLYVVEILDQGASTVLQFEDGHLVCPTNAALFLPHA